MTVVVCAARVYRSLPDASSPRVPPAQSDYQWGGRPEGVEGGNAAHSAELWRNNDASVLRLYTYDLSAGAVRGMRTFPGRAGSVTAYCRSLGGLTLPAC